MIQTHHQSAQTSVVLQTRAVPSGDAQGIVAQLYGAALSDKLKLLSLDSDHPPYVPSLGVCVLCVCGHSPGRVCVPINACGRYSCVLISANGSVLFSPPTGAWQSRMKKLEVWIFINSTRTHWFLVPLARSRHTRALGEAREAQEGHHECLSDWCAIRLISRRVSPRSPAQSTVSRAVRSCC